MEGRGTDEDGGGLMGTDGGGGSGAGPHHCSLCHFCYILVMCPHCCVLVVMLFLCGLIVVASFCVFVVVSHAVLSSCCCYSLFGGWW